MEGEIKIKAPNGFELETRQYGPDFTEDEREAIKSCIYKYDENTIYFKEVPKHSVPQLEIFWERLREESKTLENYCLLIDLSESSPPPSDVRKFLSVHFRELRPQLKYAGVFTGKSFLMNIAGKFVLSAALTVKFSIHKTKEEALRAIENAKQEF